MTIYEPQNGEEFTYNELIGYCTPNLEKVREKLKVELQELQKDKMVLCANILSLQGLIKKEKSIK